MNPLSSIFDFVRRKMYEACMAGAGDALRDLGVHQTDDTSKSIALLNSVRGNPAEEPFVLNAPRPNGRPAKAAK